MAVYAAHDSAALRSSVGTSRPGSRRMLRSLLFGALVSDSGASIDAGVCKTTVVSAAEP